MGTQQQINRLLKTTKSLKYTIDNVPKKDIQNVAQQGLAQAKQFAPVNTGALQKAIVLRFKDYGEVWIVSEQPKKEIYTGVDGHPKTTTPLPYHVWIETGYQHSSQNHYMRKTAEQISQKLFNHVNNKIKAALS